MTVAPLEDPAAPLASTEQSRTGEEGPAGDTLLQRQLRTTEMALEQARVNAEQAASGAVELVERLRALERAIVATSREPARLQGFLRQQERATRIAEQRLHAEGARRQELEAELAELAGRLELGAERIRTLEIAVEEQTRRADEAEHIAEVARVAQRKAERRLAESDRVEELHAYRDAWEAIERARTRLEAHRRGAGPTPAPASDAVPDSNGLHHRPSGPNSCAPDSPSAPEGAGPVAELPTWIDGDRLSAALERLREAAAAPQAPTVASVARSQGEEEPQVASVAQSQGEAESQGSAGAARPWLPQALRELGSADPQSAGRVILGMLPAVHAVIGAPVSFDLMLSDRSPLAVSADPAEGCTRVVPIEGPRAGEERSFALAGDTAGLGRLATGGPLQVRFGRGVARADGRRRLPEPLRALVRSPLSIAQLDVAGVALDPADVMRLLAIGLASVPVRNDALLLLHEHPGGGARTGIEVRSGHAPHFLPPDAAATRSSEATIVVCGASDLLAVLAGMRPAAEVRGARAGLERLSGWVARMQSP